MFIYNLYFQYMIFHIIGAGYRHHWCLFGSWQREGPGRTREEEGGRREESARRGVSRDGRFPASWHPRDGESPQIGEAPCLVAPRDGESPRLWEAPCLVAPRDGESSRLGEAPCLVAPRDGESPRLGESPCLAAGRGVAPVRGGSLPRGPAGRGVAPREDGEREGTREAGGLPRLESTRPAWARQWRSGTILTVGLIQRPEEPRFPSRGEAGRLP